MSSMISNHKKLFADAPLLALFLYCLGISAAIVWLAVHQPTTALGDPYAQDSILAPARAFIPWGLTMATLLFALLFGLSEWWNRRRRSPKKTS